MEEHFEKTNPRVRLLMHQQLLQRLQLPAFLCSPGASLYLDICIFSAAPSRWTCADLFLPLFSRNEYAAYSIIVCGSLLSFPFQRP